MTRSGALPAALAALFCVAAPAAAADRCDRACLTGFVDIYVEAMLRHSPADAKLGGGARISENQAKIAAGDGIWRTATSIGKARQYVADVDAQEIGLQAIVYEGTAPVIVALRLKIGGGAIVEAEQLVTRDGEGGPPFEPEGFLIREAPYIRDVPIAVRSDRRTLLDVAADYWRRATTTHQTSATLFMADCFHFQNGVNTDWERDLTPPETAEPDRNAPQAYDGRIWTCARELVLTTAPWTAEREAHRLVDVERGLVMTWNLVDVAGRPGPDGKIPPLPAASAPLARLPGNAPPGLSQRGWALRAQPQTLYHAEVKRIVGGRIQREQVFQRSLPAGTVAAFGG